MYIISYIPCILVWCVKFCTNRNSICLYAKVVAVILLHFKYFFYFTSILVINIENVETLDKEQKYWTFIVLFSLFGKRIELLVFNVIKFVSDTFWYFSDYKVISFKYDTSKFHNFHPEHLLFVWNFTRSMTKLQKYLIKD